MQNLVGSWVYLDDRLVAEVEGPDRPGVDGGGVGPAPNVDHVVDLVGPRVDPDNRVRSGDEGLRSRTAPAERSDEQRRDGRYRDSGRRERPAAPGASVRDQRALGRGRKVGTRRVPVARVLRHSPADHRVHRAGQLRSALGRGRRLLFEVCPGDRKPGIARERRLAGQALVEQAAERVHVRPSVDVAALDLLGRQVRRRSERGSLRLRRCPLRQPARQPEVGEVDVLVVVEQHVRRLHVPVHEPLRVRGVERLRDLRDDRQRPRRVERSLMPEERAQIRALDPPHRQVQPTFRLPGVMDGDDVRVLERHRELGLAGEARAVAPIPRERRRHHLERDPAAQPHVVGQVDDAHSALADRLLDPVIEEILRDVGARGHESPRSNHTTPHHTGQPSRPALSER